MGPSIIAIRMPIAVLRQIRQPGHRLAVKVFTQVRETISARRPSGARGRHIMFRVILARTMEVLPPRYIRGAKAGFIGITIAR